MKGEGRGGTSKDKTFVYNGLGELEFQQDARGAVFKFEYDALGRQVKRQALLNNDLTVDSWQYNAIGELIEEKRGSVDSNVFDVTPTVYPFKKVPTYDDTSRRPEGYTQTVITTTDTETYNVEIDTHNYYGRPVRTSYPAHDDSGNRIRIEHQYNGQGYPSMDLEAGQTDFLRRIDSMNPAVQITTETYGNGTFQSYSYHQETWQAKSIEFAWVDDSASFGGRKYGYDVWGNIVASLDTRTQFQETFRYDHLHRLRTSTREHAEGDNDVFISYDKLGNILTKSDTVDGLLEYGDGSGSAGPNAVAGGRVAESNGTMVTASYDYDANGNRTAGPLANDVVVYDAYNKPTSMTGTSMTGNGTTIAFKYGSGQQRYWQYGPETTIYVGKMFEHKVGAADPGDQETDERFKAYLGNYAVWTVSENGEVGSLRYLHRDRLGSVVAITTADGTILPAATRDFDVFGKPRNGNNRDSADGLNGADITTRGFTAHEHLNAVELIHMNGRAFDYQLGRFLSVDPFIQFPENSQSLNPYSYILNNPLSGTDPSGYISCGASMGGIDNCDRLNRVDPEYRQFQARRNYELLVGGNGAIRPESLPSSASFTQHRKLYAVNLSDISDFGGISGSFDFYVAAAQLFGEAPWLYDRNTALACLGCSLGRLAADLQNPWRNRSKVRIGYKDLPGRHHHSYVELIGETESYYISAYPENSSHLDGFYIMFDLGGADPIASEHFGSITTEHGEWARVNETVDPDSASQTWVTRLPFDEAKSIAIQFSLDVDKARVPYLPLEQNSNSFAHQLAEILIGHRPEPPVLAIGSDFEIETD